MGDMYAYIDTHVLVPGKDSITAIKRVGLRKKYHSGNLVSEPNNNPILETIIYYLEFPDVHVE